MTKSITATLPETIPTPCFVKYAIQIGRDLNPRNNYPPTCEKAQAILTGAVTFFGAVFFARPLACVYAMGFLVPV
jgi:hypothetical protein